MKILSDAIAQTVKKLFNIDCSIELSRTEPQFGDFSTNIAMQLAGRLGQNPRAIADQISEEFSGQKFEWCKKTEVAGPGFINVYLDDAYIFNSFSAEPTKIYAGKKVVAEYSDPNAFKALHAGHLYTTLVGDAIANIMELSGAEVYRLNYGGDVGLHAAKAMWGIIAALGSEDATKLESVPKGERSVWVSARYVEGNKAYEADESAHAQITTINKQIYELHTSGDTESEFAKIYWTCRQWSYDGFEKLYDELHVHKFDEYIPESKVTPLGQNIVKQGLEQGVFEESDGAIVYSEAQSGLHTRVFITSKGLPTYEAKELGLAVYKWQSYKFDKSLVITANDIVEYMKVLLSAMEHFYPEVAGRTKHLTHGMIKFSGGQKMSSRTGNVLMAADIIDAAIAANTESSGKHDESVAIGAIKYAFLKQRLGGDIMYNPEESISLNGNSGPYLQYAHARACSILSKISTSDDAGVVSELDEHERLLAIKLSEYVEAVEHAATDYMPHHICSYLYELTQVFNRFYENSKVVGDSREALRGVLVLRYKDVLARGLAILGVAAPEKM
jgi:arginyl-tRNA synthetase